MLKGKTVVLGVTGSIAAYKIANLASMLVKMHAQVHVLMTKNATNFINPITFETLTSTKCLVDTFDRNFQYSVEHVALAKQADVVLIAPASANVIGKIAGGIADDMLTTTVMACKCKKIIAPAMNTNMYENPIKIIWRNFVTMVTKLLLRQLDIWLVKMLERVSSHRKKFYWNIFYVRFVSKKIWKAKKYLLLPVRPSKQLIRYALFLIVPQVKWDMRLRELLCSEVRR